MDDNVKCFLLRSSYVEGVREVLSTEQYREYLDCLVQLGLQEECTATDPLVRAFLRDKAIFINRTNKNYERAKENGKKGGRGHLVTRKEIEAVIEAYGAVRIKDLASFFGVSERTISRYISQKEVKELADFYSGSRRHELKSELSLLADSPIEMPAMESMPFD